LSNGDLYCWGYNEYGQVGNGTTKNQLTPVKILSDVESVHYYENDESCISAITENGDLYCWGYNEHGEAGNGTTKNQLTPVKVLTDVKSVSYFQYLSEDTESFDSYVSVSAITENGDLYRWGSNKYGLIGNGTEEDQLTPVKVLSNVKSVSANSSNPSFMSAITEEGDLYCWGDNGYGQVGNGTKKDQLVPVKVLTDVKSVSYSYTPHFYNSSVGPLSVLAITEEGDLYCWGDNDSGQIGNGTKEVQLTPVKALSGVKSVSVFSYNDGDYDGYSWSISISAITEEGDLYCWGDNDSGQIGSGTKEEQLTPLKVLSGVKSVPSAYSAITENGDLYCWGDNKYGQVGNGTTENQLTPIRILSNVKSCFPVSSYKLAITEEGDLYCWGYNDCGQIGNGTEDNQLTPLKVLTNVKSFSPFSINNMSAITEEGDLYCWGGNDAGVAGNGTEEAQLVPLKVLSDVKSFSFSSSHSSPSRVSAITKEGDLYCWGCNDCGQIGNGTTENQFTPMKILSNIKSFSFSSYDSQTAITEEGDLYCWGGNDYGQVGNGTTEDRLSPVKVLRITEVTVPTNSPDVEPAPSRRPTETKPPKSSATPTPTLSDGKKYTADNLIYQYQKNSLTFIGIKKPSNVSVVDIPKTVFIAGKKYPVKAVAANALKNNKNIKQVVVGKNITKIRKKAFSNCRNLWKITIKSQKLTAKNIEKNVFQKPGGNAKKRVYVYLPKNKYKTYKKILQARGIQSKNVKVTFSRIK